MTCGGALDVDGARRFADAGADRLVIPGFGRTAEQYKEMLGSFGENVIAKL